MEEKPLTLSQLVEYNEKSLIPQLEERFVTRKEFDEFKDQSLLNQDSILKKLDRLLENDDIRNYQEKKEKELFAIMIKAMKEHNILSAEDLNRIAKLDIF